MPVRNELACISHLLACLVAQDYDDIVEFLLVDGLSEDGTRDIIAKAAQRDGRLKLIDNPDGVVTTALNTGLSHAQGQIIVRLDAHADYSSDYVTRCVHVLRETGAGNVGGAAVPASDGSFIGNLIVALHESPFGIGAAKFRRADGEGWVDTLWPGAYRREALEAAGRYYVPGLNRSEDIELNSRLRKAGWGIYLSPKIKARYYPRKSLTALCRQNYGNGVAIAQTLRAGLGGVSLRHLVPMAFVLALMVCTVAALIFPMGVWALAAVGALYLLAAVASSAKAGRSYGVGVVLLLPLAFLLLHLSYGFGSILGFLLRARPLDVQEHACESESTGTTG